MRSSVVDKESMICKEPLIVKIVYSLLILSLHWGSIEVQAGVTAGSKELGAVWMIGDSITQGNADGDEKSSPRKALYDLLINGGYHFSFTGHHDRNLDGLPTKGGGVLTKLYQYHSGISGIRIGEIGGDRGFATRLEKIWQTGRLAKVKPNVILIMLGTNDVTNPIGATGRLKKLVEAIYSLPDLGNPTVLLATIPPNGRVGERHLNDQRFVQTFNQAVPEIVTFYDNAGKDIHLVDQFTPLSENFKASMRADKLHPNGLGNQTMAKQWYRAIEELVGLKQAKNQKEAGNMPELPGEKTDFHGFAQYKLKTSQGEISIVCPAKPAAGNPWLWRSIFWGKSSNAIKRVTNGDITLLKEGYHVVIAPGDVSGHPSGNAEIDAAYKLLTEEYGFAKKLSMASMSRETLALFAWASQNPDKIESIYVDNGVCNVNSWPAGKLVAGNPSKGGGNAGSWALMKKTYGMSSDAEMLKAKVSPIDLLGPLAKANVPILMVCGTVDKAVPYEENGAIMKKRYEELGGEIEIIFEEKGHHPHGLLDPTPVLNFIKSNHEKTQEGNR